MPIFTKNEIHELLSIPSEEPALIQATAFSEDDMVLINKRRGAANKLGFAVQLCWLTHIGTVLEKEAKPNQELLSLIASNIGIDADMWQNYSERETTRWEHLQEIYVHLKISPFKKEHTDEVTEYHR